MRQHSDNISTAGTSNSFHLTPLPKVQTWTHEIPLSLRPPPCEGKLWLWLSVPHRAPFIATSVFGLFSSTINAEDDASQTTTLIREISSQSASFDASCFRRLQLQDNRL
ncbi:hypothetical protein OPV22_022903 [Ensete ventricosum]|uniref:Uncharacterized protein n=1 Tax=Ensete ventricosum TaxID=4639 RepID=A0AAV8PEL6_ENSVE|nr:hypothetical protein OPV22_022903 [Ensete ventricosum]